MKILLIILTNIYKYRVNLKQNGLQDWEWSEFQVRHRGYKNVELWAWLNHQWKEVQLYL